MARRHLHNGGRHATDRLHDDAQRAASRDSYAHDERNASVTTSLFTLITGV
jgi:hypothetical protein